MLSFLQGSTRCREHQTRVGMAQSVEHIVHIMGRGAEAPPVADKARRKRSEQQVMRAAAKQDADCKLDRASEA